MSDDFECKVTVTLVKNMVVQCPRCQALNSAEASSWRGLEADDGLECGECGRSSMLIYWDVKNAP